MKINLKITALGIFSAVEILGFVGFIAVLIYCITQSAQIVALGDILHNPLTITMVVLLAIGSIGFFISNPGQDKLDEAQMNEWRRGRMRIAA